MTAIVDLLDVVAARNDRSEQAVHAGGEDNRTTHTAEEPIGTLPSTQIIA